jgi:hypothetical protein
MAKWVVAISLAADLPPVIEILVSPHEHITNGCAAPFVVSISDTSHGVNDLPAVMVGKDHFCRFPSSVAWHISAIP